jgi:hypothetical protein
MQFHHSDPHLRKEEEFGVPGRAMKVGKEKFVVCTVIGAPPHTWCPFYRQHQVMISKSSAILNLQGYFLTGQLDKHCI